MNTPEINVEKKEVLGIILGIILLEQQFLSLQLNTLLEPDCRRGVHIDQGMDYIIGLLSHTCQ